MTKFLRSHPLLATVASLVLLVLGTWLLFWQDAGDLSDSAMTKTYLGFLSFCSGLVGIMILVFRPFILSEQGHSKWEATRAQGKKRFIWQRFMFGTPLLIGLFIAFVRDVRMETLYPDLVRGFIVIAVFAGAILLFSSELWKQLEGQQQTELRSGHVPHDDRDSLK